MLPLGALAEEDTANSQCNIYIQYLNDAKHSQSGQVVLGSLWLQQFKNYVNYDLAGFTATYQFQLSDSNTLNGAYIGAASFAEDDSPFTLLYGAKEQIYINTDVFEYKTTMGAQLGFQGNVQFQVSLLGQYVQAFTDDCLQKLGGTRFASCDSAPTYAQSYFNQTVYYSEYNTPTFEGPYGGYNTSGYTYNTGVCTQTVGTKYFCTTSPALFYASDSVYADNWNYGSSAASGTFGFGKNSPVWEIVGSPATKEYDVYMANFNGWTWADPTWTATTLTSVMNIGEFSKAYSQTDAHTTFAPATIGSYLFAMDIFGFGKTNIIQNSEFYEDLMNFDVDQTVYGVHQNTSSLAMNFRGLGLPTKQFNKFSNLLSVITKGESTCLSRKSGYCALARTCDAYTASGLWDYDFKIKFSTSLDSNYIRVPLATFAANFEAEGGVCVIFVEYLDSQYDDSKSIMLGSMLFQSIYAQYTLAGVNAVQVALFANKNALASTYVGAQENTAGDNPFAVIPADVLTDASTETNGLPTFLATAAGITDSMPYWHLDFSSARTIAWATDCQTTGFGNYPAGECSSEPVNAINGFDGTPLPASTGTFTDAQFGGYVVSGTKYTSKLCFGNFNCKFVQLYGVETVSANEWNFNGDGSYGIIGMGPGSFIWEGFVDPTTK